MQHHEVAPGFDDQRPYAIALVSPDARLPGRIVGVAPEGVQVGGRVEAEVVDLPGGSRRVVVFRASTR